MNDIHQKINILKVEIEQYESILTRLEAEVLDLNQQLGDFSERYEKIVAPVARRLEAAHEAYKELSRQLYIQKRHGPLPDPDADDSWQPPENYISVAEQYKRAWQPEAPGPAVNPLTGEMNYPEAVQTEDSSIKKLYRQLARRFHPDLTTDPEERDYRTRIMASLNEAYQAGDRAALEALARQKDHVQHEQPLAILHLRELEQIKDQLEARIAELKHERSMLLTGELMKLSLEEKLAGRKKQHYLQDMASRMEKEYAEYMVKIAELRQQLL